MKIFLASPGDATNYRQAAQRVADRLNEESGVKLGSELFLEVVDWNRHIAPLMSLPEDAVLSEVAVDEADVFLGLAWLGFDTVTSSPEGDAGPSTERNFELAYRYWKDRQAAHCWRLRLGYSDKQSLPAVENRAIPTWGGTGATLPGRVP